MMSWAMLSPAHSIDVDGHLRVQAALGDLRQAEALRDRALATWAPAVEARGEWGHTYLQDTVRGTPDPAIRDTPGWTASVVVTQPILKDQTLIDDLAQADALIALRRAQLDDARASVIRETIELILAKSYATGRRDVAISAMAELGKVQKAATSRARAGDVTKLDVLEAEDRVARWQTQATAADAQAKLADARMMRLWATQTPLGDVTQTLGFYAQTPGLPGAKSRGKTRGSTRGKNPDPNPGARPGNSLGNHDVTRAPKPPGFCRVTTPGNPATQTPGFAPGDCDAQARANGPGVAAAQAQLAQADAALGRRTRPRLPELWAEASAGRTLGTGGNIETDEAALQLKAKVPLFWGLEPHAEMVAARNAQAAAHDRLRLAQVEAAGEAGVAWTSIVQGLAQLKALSAREKIASATLGATQDAYLAKERDARALLDATETLAAIRMERLRLEEEVAVNRMRLDHASGQIVDNMSEIN